MIGRLDVVTTFPASAIGARRVDVWLPPDLPSDALPVLYMHDGQNLFEAEHATHGIPWGMDASIHALMRRGAIRGAIVVGIWSTDARRREYMPARAWNLLPSTLRRPFQRDEGGPPCSDAYLRFLVSELKPWVDRTYPVDPAPEATFLLGSSMGGLISVYAVCEYPEVFAGAGCLSTHWPAGEGVMIDYLARALPAPGRHRLYFDHGSEGLDAEYAPYQNRVDEVLRGAGWQEEIDFLTRRFPGAGHHEAAWAARVPLPLTFLFAAP